MLKKYGFVVLLTLTLLQACVNLQLAEVPALPTPRTIETVSPENSPTLNVTPTESVSTSPTAAVTASTPLPKVTISAVKGNLFIRRGPDMAYNPISVLYDGTSAVVIARDVLSKWVQVKIPGSENTGWVSLQTKYSKVEGDISALPGFTTTEWPVPAYLRNCTHHQMFIMPGEITLVSSFGVPENEIWLYPGTYTVYDLDLPDLPEVLSFDIREGQEIEIKVDGTGERRICP
jgi:hypothetical protein